MSAWADALWRRLGRSRRSRVLAVIPARWDSSRFPGKPLALIDGKPMIQVRIRGQPLLSLRARASISSNVRCPDVKADALLRASLSATQHTWEQARQAASLSRGGAPPGRAVHPQQPQPRAIKQTGS